MLSNDARKKGLLPPKGEVKAIEPAPEVVAEVIPETVAEPERPMMPDFTAMSFKDVKAYARGLEIKIGFGTGKAALVKDIKGKLLQGA